MPKIDTEDWRDLKNREELFFRYFKWRMYTYDLDHSHYCKVLTEGLTKQQKCWFSFLFGMTYRTPQAYAYWYTFPNLETLDLGELKLWNADNWKRTTYGTDARYNKGHFHAQVSSLISWKGKWSLCAKVESLVASPSPKKNFETLFAGICELFKFGRMTAWITCQCLYDTLGLNINFDNVLIRNPNNDSSMQSIWNGYCILKGHYSKLLGKYATTDYRVTDVDLKHVAQDIMKYREKANKYAGTDVDVFKWESIWCQFKRLFNPVDSKEYPGHSSGDATSRYSYYKEHWPEVDLKPLRKALLSQPGIIKGRTYVNAYNKVFGKTGLLMHMHEMYDDLPNAYECLDIDPNKDIVSQLFKDHGMRVPSY